MTRLSILFTLIALTGATPVGVDPSWPVVHITLVNCASNIGKASKPRLIAIDMESHRYTKEQTLPQRAYQPITRWDVNLPPGFYDVVLVDGACSDAILLPVLRGHDRSIFAIASESSVMHSSVAMLAGTLPFKGASVDILYDPKTVPNALKGYRLEVKTTVVGDAFYATSLASGVATLEVRNTNDVGTVLQFPAGVITSSGAGSRVVIHVTEADVEREALREQGRRSVAPNSGSSRPF
jgi:hypothetical protein